LINKREEERPIDERVIDERVIDERVIDERVIDERVIDERVVDERVIDERHSHRPLAPSGVVAKCALDSRTGIHDHRCMTLDRRQFLAGTAIATVAACANDKPAPVVEPPARPAPAPLPPDEPTIVRIASVKTAVEGALLPALVESFEKSTAYRVRVTAGTQVYEQAREGKVDLVISHYGHRDAEAFVLDGLGEWPRMIFSNQMVLVGPPSDPAKVRGLTDLAEAFRRIVESRSTYLVNETDGVRYLTEILWNAIGKPSREGWLVEAKVAKDAAIAEAVTRGAYTLWGLTPFLRTIGDRPLEALVIDDPLLHRMMVSVLVKPSSTIRINAEGAMAFQTHLLQPATQAAIRTIHYPAQDATWVPAGRHNRSGMLPKA
jgi:tungstate transport system substrate-binding protein